jgi:hypothetical protein
MTTIDTRIREAWNTGDPMSLHAAAEQLASEGNEESAIYDALERLLLEVRDADADDNTEERIMGVMDRLSGWCHESGHIRTKRVGLPNVKEIADLPRWARVAYAARNARRVLPFFRFAWPDASARQQEQIVRAVILAERSAQHGFSVFEEALKFDGFMMHLGDHASRTAGAALIVAGKVVDPDAQAKLIYEASQSVKMVGETQYARADFERLRSECKQGQWTDSDRVSPEVFGPLWPKGPPPGWPEIIPDPNAAATSVESVVEMHATQN